MLDGTISRLRAYNDRTLRRDVENDAEEMMKLVRKFFHCG